MFRVFLEKAGFLFGGLLNRAAAKAVVYGTPLSAQAAASLLDASCSVWWPRRSPSAAPGLRYLHPVVWSRVIYPT